VTGTGPADGRVSVVIATRDRPRSLTRTLDRLAALRPVPPVIVVDNASRAGPPRDHPAVRHVIALDRNLGAAARPAGAYRASTPYVAFSDDDSWWAPGALPVAADALDRHPGLALVAGRTLVGAGRQPDPANAAMAGSPLPAIDHLPGRRVLGCLACATVVRRDAYLGVGGFHELMQVGGEETLLCYDLAAAGWQIRYLDRVVALHHPSPSRPPRWRRQARQRRNEALVRWMRRPLPVAVLDTWELARASTHDPVARAALAGLLRRLPAAVASRHRLPDVVERDVRLLEQSATGAAG
jgi:GT2 family glycosyltransferase